MSVIIPYSNNDSQEISVLFRSFVNDLVDEYGKLFISGVLKPAQAWKQEAVWIKYCSSYVTEKDRDVADRLVLKRGSEAVRKYALEAFSAEMFEMLDAGNPFMGEIVSSPEMKLSFDSFVSELKPVEHYGLLLRRYGFKENDLSDKKVLNCFLDCLGYEVIERKDFEPYAVLKTQFGRAKSKLVKLIGPLRKYMKTDPVPRCYETDVFPFMRGKGWSQDDCDMMFAFLSADEHEYEWSGPDKNKHNWVALRWEFLSENDRIERILFDNKEKYSDGWMSLSEIRKEYDRLAIIYRRDPLSRNPNCGGKHTEPMGNGVYRYNPNYNPKKKRPKLKDELKRFVVLNNGLCSFDDAIKYAQSIQKCSEITVDLYLRKNGCVSGTMKGKKGTYYCDEACQGQYPDFVRRTMREVVVTKEEAILGSRDILVAAGKALHITKELIPLFKKKTGKQYIPASFVTSLKAAEGILFSFPTRKGTIELSVPANQARSFDVKAFLNPPTKKETVQNAAAEYLLAAPQYTMSKKDLAKELIKAGAFSSDVNVSNLYQYLDDILFDDKGTGKGGSYTLNISEYNRRYGFSDSFNWKTLKEQIVRLVGDSRLNGSVADKMYSIMQNVAVKPFGSTSEMWRILKMVSSYINDKPSNSENELLVIKLHLGLEVFLKQYGGDRYSKDALQPYITILQGRGQLPQKYGYYGAGTIEKDIDENTGEMVKIRNFICHKLNEGYNNPSFYADRIKKNLRYYLLVAAYAQKNGF